MSTSERQLTEQGKERKQQLLDAAAALFADRGYGPTRIADICEAAGVAKGLFYWYFPTKETLFVELVRSMRTSLRRVQAAAMADTDDPLEKIRRGAAASVRYMSEHRAYFALLETERDDEQIVEVLRESNLVYSADATNLVRAAQKQGSIPDDHDPELLALGVTGTVSHFSHYHRLGRVDIDVDELGRFVGDWIVRALSGA
ncbi:MAG: TetR/AcrR family transcriptional regulator [Ilumatobacteraceae bacterium]